MLATSPLGRKANRFDWLQRVVLGVGRSSGCGCGGAAAAVGSDVPPIFCIPARDQVCLAPRGSLEIYVHFVEQTRLLAQKYTSERDVRSMGLQQTMRWACSINLQRHPLPAPRVLPLRHPARPVSRQTPSTRTGPPEFLRASPHSCARGTRALRHSLGPHAVSSRSRLPRGRAHPASTKKRRIKCVRASERRGGGGGAGRVTKRIVTGQKIPPRSLGVRALPSPRAWRRISFCNVPPAASAGRSAHATYRL